MTARVTVGLPVYNGGRFIGAAIESILAQTLTEFELIVSDNASTDETGDIARAYAAKDPRVRYVRNATNVGLAANYNRVFEQARTPYFKWATSDDALRPEFLERCVECLDRESDVVVAYPCTRFVDDSGAPLDRKDPGLELPWDDPVLRFRKVLSSAGWANVILGVIRSDALRRTGLVPSYASGDFGLLGELSLLGKFREIPEALHVRRLHERSSSQHGKDPAWLSWYITGSAERLSLRNWSRVLHHLRSVRRSGLSRRAKALLAGSILAMAWARRGKLASEIGDWTVWRISGRTTR